jgi:hypothetical protein
LAVALVQFLAPALFVAMLALAHFMAQALSVALTKILVQDWGAE